MGCLPRGWKDRATQQINAFLLTTILLLPEAATAVTYGEIYAELAVVVFFALRFYIGKVCGEKVVTFFGNLPQVFLATSDNSGHCA